MSRVLRDPQVRVLVAVAVVVLAVAMSWHLVAMGVHGMAMMLGLCVAILAAAASLVVPAGPGLRAPPLAFAVRLERPTRERVERLGRHPPDEGIRLRH